MRWMNLEPILQSEVSQKKKNKYRMLMHMHGIYNGHTDESICRAACASYMELLIKNLPANAGDVKDMGLILGLERSRDASSSLVWEDPLQEGMVTPSSILAWIISWTEEPDELQSMGSHD